VYCTSGAPGIDETEHATLSPTQNVVAGSRPSWSIRNNASDRPASACANAALKSCPWRVLFRPDVVRATTAMLRKSSTMITAITTIMFPRSSRGRVSRRIIHTPRFREAGS